MYPYGSIQQINGLEPGACDVWHLCHNIYACFSAVDKDPPAHRWKQDQGRPDSRHIPDKPDIKGQEIQDQVISALRNPLRENPRLSPFFFLTYKNKHWYHGATVGVAHRDSSCRKNKSCTE